MHQRSLVKQLVRPAEQGLPEREPVFIHLDDARPMRTQVPVSLVLDSWKLSRSVVFSDSAKTAAPYKELACRKRTSPRGP